MKKYEFNDCINELEIDPRFLKEGMNYAKKHDYQRIRVIDLNSAGKTLELDLSPFLNSSISLLDISDNFKTKNVDVTPIYTLSNLTELDLTNPAIKVDFTKLPSIETLYLESKKELDLNCLDNLKHLFVRSIRNKDCNFIDQLKNLEILRLTGGIIESLTGIEYLPKLKEIVLGHCQKLTNIDTIKDVKNLQKLHIEKCSKLRDYAVLAHNSSIKHLFISDLDNISFVATMKKLEFLKFWDLKDGDLDPVLASRSLQKVDFYPNKRHYNYSVDQINKLMAGKV